MSSHEYDRSKLLAYATAAVKEVWLVLAPEKQIEVYRQPANGEYADRQTVAEHGRLTCAPIPEWALEASAVFAN